MTMGFLLKENYYQTFEIAKVICYKNKFFEQLLKITIDF